MKPRVGSKKFVQQGRSPFEARSVLVIREHSKRATCLREAGASLRRRQGTRAVAIAASGLRRHFGGVGLARRRPLAAFFNRPMNQWDQCGRVLGLLVLGLCWGLGLSSCDNADPTVTITAEEFRFSPTTFDLPPHQRVRLIVRNQGREQHVFQSPILTHQSTRVVEDSTDVPRPSGNAIPIQPGKQVELFMKLSPGLYRFWCRIRGHAGMEGALMVHNRD